MAADPAPPSPPRVCLATMVRESLNLHTHVGIVQCLTQGLLAYHLPVSSGPYLDAGRNRAIALGLAIPDTEDDQGVSRPPWDWFLFVDGDIEFTPDHLRVLFAPTLHPDYSPTRYPLLGGVYVNPFPGDPVPGEEDDDPPDAHFGPVAYEWATVTNLPGEMFGQPVVDLRRISRSRLATRAPVDTTWNPPTDNGTPSPITEVDALGTGFLAIHRSLIDSMFTIYGEPLPWFHEPVHTNRVHYGEDLGFAIRVRDLGYPVLAHRACTPIHHKTTKLI